MEPPSRHTVKLVVLVLIAYTIGGPLLAWLGAPVLQTPVTGSCTAVTTGDACCGPTRRATGAIWAPVLEFLILPAQQFNAFIQGLSGVKANCACRLPQADMVARNVDGQCRMATDPRDVQLEVRCSFAVDSSQNAVRISNSGMEGLDRSYTIHNITVDGAPASLFDASTPYTLAPQETVSATYDGNRIDETVNITVTVPDTDVRTTVSRRSDCWEDDG